MTVESKHAVAIAALSDWLKNLMPLFQPVRSKTETNRTCAHDFSRAMSKFQVIARNSDWFIVRFASVVIGRSNYFGIGFSTVI